MLSYTIHKDYPRLALVNNKERNGEKNESEMEAAKMAFRGKWISNRAT